MAPIRGLFGLALLLALAGCALYSDVSIGPLLVTPAKIDRGADLSTMIKKADYLRAVELAPQIDARSRKSASELVSLGFAEMSAARYDSAKRHLRAALDLNPYRTLYAEAAWNLSQIEYMQNNYATSLEWAEMATKNGLMVLPWHLEYLRVLSNVQIYKFAGLPSDEVPLRIGRPDLPRIDVRINRTNAPSPAVIDSGAVLSIVSNRLAESLPVRRLAVSNGTFYGLLGEPISVKFGLIDELELGAVVVQNVPVAIMPDEKMRFVVTGKSEYRIDFLIGANLLKELRTELNFSRNTVTFTRLTSADKQPVADQNLFFQNFRPNVRGTVNKHGWFLFVLDTGSEVTYLNETQLGMLPINIFTPRVHAATLQGLGGARKRGSKIENVEVGVDRWAGTFRTMPMYAAQEHDRSVGILGENFLKNFDVVIDFGRMRVDLKRR